MSIKGKHLLVALIITGMICGIIGYIGYTRHAPSETVPTSTPTPAPPSGPRPPLKYRYGVEPALLVGFNRTTSEFHGDAYLVLVLQPGGSGTIPVTLSSTGDEDYTISISLDLAGERGVEFEGVRYTFFPSTLRLKAGGQEEPILMIEADRDAPTAYYEASVLAYVEEGGSGIGEGYAFDILVSSYTPAYIYRVHVPTPGIPAPSPVPGSTPAPAETPPPGFELVAGGRISVMFFIMNVREPVSLNVTSPPEMSFELVPDPLEVVPRPTSEGRDNVYLLVITASPDVPEGAYKMAVTGKVGSYTFKRVFSLAVRG